MTGFNAKTATATAITGLSLGVLSAVSSLSIATYFARRIITPELEKPDNVDIVTVSEDVSTVTLRAEPHTTAAGRYGLWLDGGTGHVRLGEVLDQDTSSKRISEHTVTREVLGVDAGVMAPGPARWNAYFYCGTPGSALGLAYDDVLIRSDIGDLPAWRVRPDSDDGRWAILVHGRSARREETLRAIPELHRLGFTALVPMYRNDEGAPASIDGRYNLGLSEWRDIEAAIRYAALHGARDIALVGWSMGAGIVLQMLDRSAMAGWVDRVVLDGPVIDWGDVISYQAEVNNLPPLVDGLAKILLGRRVTRRLVGIAEPIDIGVTNWVSRSAELAHPILLIHSAADDVVPHGPSVELAAARPDLVRLALWDEALHCREWNTDPGRWESLVADFLTAADGEVDARSGRTGTSSTAMPR
ncbi:MAG: alpha/beta hydrolase [Ornithinimicrobium sp.]